MQEEARDQTLQSDRLTAKVKLTLWTHWQFTWQFKRDMGTIYSP